ncbi:MAG: hypothetical protein Q8M09_15120 [Pseudomonadota bacterium]|nr:hypothetical protein [Pseudomonadota bacterium]MDP1905556.1 hypothetical protein [Pseudomonadota bacterium]
MKAYFKLISVAVCFAGLTGCVPRLNSHAYSEVCAGVTALSWKKNAQGADAETILKVATTLAAAAEADTSKIKNLGSASAEINLQSELARVIKENVQISSEVESNFWEQNINFTQAACWCATLLDRSDLSLEQKERALATVDRIINSRIEFKNEVVLKKSPI